MRIKKSKIISVTKYLSGIEEGASFYIGLIKLEDFTDKLISAGIVGELNIKNSFLPNIIGKVSKYNAEGKFKIRKDLPRETKYREIDIKDWHGSYHSVSVPYKRYPRELINPPKINLIIQNDGGNKILISPQLINSNENKKEIKHILNLFLELFGECHTLQDNLTPAFRTTRKLNWTVLPPGEYPWERLKGQVSKVIDNYQKTDEEKVIIKSRIKRISEKTPDFVAIGEKGFNGYMIFGFKSKAKYILESVHSGNATYIFGQDWQELSKLTKAQILQENKQLDRLIHNQSWLLKLNSHLN